MSKEYLEAFNRITMNTEYDNESSYDSLHFGNDCKLVDKALERLEQIDNANPSEALKWLEKYRLTILFNTTVVENALLKAQENEKENELLKEIIKSFFDRGCPLHQYVDREGVLQIEVDDECSNMRLGEYKGIDLDKKLKEVLE